MEIQLVLIGRQTERLSSVLSYALEGIKVKRQDSIGGIKKGLLLFAAAIDEAGMNRPLYELTCELRANAARLDGVTAGVIIDGAGELYTKACARELLLAANACGCAFVGKPLVEATGMLQNFRKLSEVLKTDPIGAYKQSARELVKRLLEYEKPALDKANILTLYASNRAQSNTYALFDMVKRNFTSEISSTEIMLRNGAVADCEGCPYTTCLHFSERGKCFYGGVIVEEVYPALNECDALMLLCPNYNDGLDANITAFINRMTALMLKTRFFDKPLFAIVVSGYSGGDIVASQLIGALNMNKSFQLPPRFCMLETANDPGSIYEVNEIEKRAKSFAAAISGHLLNKK